MGGVSLGSVWSSELHFQLLTWTVPQKNECACGLPIGAAHAMLPRHLKCVALCFWLEALYQRVAPSWVGCLASKCVCCGGLCSLQLII